MLITNRRLPRNGAYSIKQVFNVTQHSLSPVPTCPLPNEGALNRVIIRRFTQQGTRKCIKIGYPLADLQFVLLFRWNDGSEFFNTSTAHLRALQLSGSRTPHRRVTQWQTLFRIDLHLPSLWRETWLPFRSASENCFLWQLIHRTPATQHWRFPHLPSTDQQTWCTRCDLREMEDILHCIWFCPISRKVWQWVNHILCLSMTSTDCSPRLRPAHIFVALPLPNQLGIPKHLWDILRAATAWNIWKDRCRHFIDGKRSHPSAVIHQIWARIRIYLRQTWNAYLHKIRLGIMTQSVAIEHMAKAFGRSPEVWAMHEQQLQIPPVPPRPP